MSGYNDWLIQWTSVDTNVQILDNVVSARLTRQTGTSANSLEVVVNNYRGKSLASGESKIQKGDLLKMFAKKDGVLDRTALLSSQLLGSFVVIDVEYMPETNTIQFTCNDKTFELLSRVYVIKDTPAEVINTRINNIVQTINEDGVVQDPVSTDIAALRSDGSAFPSVEYSSIFKNAYEALSELSQPEMTGDNLPYVFWFDADDTFHWEYPSQTPEGTVFYDGYDPVKQIKVKTSDSEVISMVIFNAGNDQNNSAIFDYYVDPFSGSIKGKTKYVPMTDISRDLKKYYDNGAGGYTISNADFITIAKRIARGYAQAYTEIGKRGVFKASLTVNGDFYSAGKLYTVYAPDTGYLQNALRITNIVHSFGRNGWDTTLDLAQDVKALANL